MTDILAIAQDTWFTLSKSQSIDLPDEQKRLVSAGERLPLSSYEPDAGWMRVTLEHDRLPSNPFGDNLTWYVKAADVHVDKDSPSQLSFFRRIVSRILVAPKEPDTDTPPHNP